jgi:membrane-bound lytic murein transglycosylase A
MPTFKRLQILLPPKEEQKKIADTGEAFDRRIEAEKHSLAELQNTRAALAQELLSGRLRLPDGQVMRIGYDSQNGRDYVPIGRVLVDMGELPRDGVSMQSIRAWLDANPDKADQVRNANPSAVFFRELLGLDPDDGPRGALNIPVRPQVSVAVDPAFIPYGTPLIATLEGQTPRLHVAMDTGGAIKGAGRLDIFQGTGKQAGEAAGQLASKARVVLLLPRRASSRL